MLVVHQHAMLNEMLVGWMSVCKQGLGLNPAESRSYTFFGLKTPGMLQPCLFDTSFQWPETTANGTTTSKYHLSFLFLCGHSYILHFISKSVCRQYFKTLIFFFGGGIIQILFCLLEHSVCGKVVRMRERRWMLGEIDCTAESIAQPDRSSAVTWRETAAEPPLIS